MPFGEGEPTPWPFGTDADRDDPLTQHRIAVTYSHPRWFYLVAFDRESEERPTDAEVAMLVSYLEEYKDRWYGQGGYRVHMERRLLDVDGGANGVVFHKWGVDDWGYRRQSYTRGYLFTVIPPALRGEHRDGLPRADVAAGANGPHARFRRQAVGDVGEVEVGASRGVRLLTVSVVTRPWVGWRSWWPGRRQEGATR